MNFKQFNSFLIIVNVILLFAIFFYSCKNSPKENDWVKYNLKGNVESLSEFTYEAISKFGEIEKGKKVQDNVDYDGDKQFRFNKRGNLIENSEYQSDQNFTYKYFYDNQDRLIEFISFIDNMKYVITKYFYQKGNLIEKSNYASNGILHSRIKYKLDENGCPVIEFEYMSDGILYKYKRYLYDNNKKLIEEISYNSSGILEAKYNIVYDKDGFMIEENTYIPDNLLLTTTNKKYFNKGKTIETKMFTPANKNPIRIIEQYNEKGNLNKKLKYGPDGILSNNISYQYEYDKVGNWIKRITFVNTLPSHVKEREIIYFD
jgi:hypothetical protein